ncbi:MAG: isocitrate lyase/phosphoenolpyruvate mutase family protein, partial [Candidatus Binatia bacterium]
MHTSQARKADIFRALHRRPGCFVVANAWDAGTARILASLGFEALATTSAGLAFSMGRCDGGGEISPEETLENARQIVEATDLPVSADLENGWSVDPRDVAEIIRRAAAVGL